MDNLNIGNDNFQVQDPIINFDLGSKQISVARQEKLDLSKHITKLSNSNESFSNKKFSLEQLIKFRDDLKAKKTTCVEDAMIANQMVQSFKTKFTMEEFTEEPTKVNFTPLLKMVDAEVIAQEVALADVQIQAEEINNNEGKAIELSISIDKDEVLQILGEMLTHHAEQLTAIIENVNMVFFTDCNEGVPLSTVNISTDLLSDLSGIRIALPRICTNCSASEDLMIDAIKSLNISSKSDTLLSFRNMLVSNISFELQDPGTLDSNSSYKTSHPEGSQINTLNDYCKLVRDENLFNTISNLKIDVNTCWNNSSIKTALVLRELIEVLSSISVIVDILKTINT